MNKLERNIPGTIRVENREFLYIEDDGNDDFENDLFDKVTTQLAQPIAQSGGVINENCKLYIPTEKLYHCLSYKGDINGWREEIKQGAKILNLKTGRIICNDTIELSDGKFYSLKDCRVVFY